MRKYEGLFIFPPDEGPDASKEGETRLEEMITRSGGRVLDRQDWGKRLLGYPIRKFREGRLLLWNFEMETGQLGEFQKALVLSEKILKSTVVKFVVPKPPKASSKKAGSSRSASRETRPRREEEASHGRQP